MKISVLQLARLGDILQTAPAINALKRTYPDAEIHLVVRHKFANAASVIKGVDKLWTLKTHEILAPIINEQSQALESSLQSLDGFTKQLREQEFTKIVNLSFSPFSSYLVSSLATEETEVTGYSRFSDGYMGLKDDLSAYFYAQVGINKFNRIHLIDIFANMCGVELISSDFMHEIKGGKVQRKIVYHVGASSEAKAIDVFKSKQILRKLNKIIDAEIVLVGSSDEVEKSDEIMAGEMLNRVSNLVGKTEFNELFDLCAHAKVIIGPDSLFMQIASLVGTAALNISFDSVNFWETGPVSKNSRILKVKNNDELISDDVIRELKAMLAFQAATKRSICTVENAVERYSSFVSQPGDFEWKLIKALYMGESYPLISSESFSQAVERLQEVADLSQQQIDSIKKGMNVKECSAILTRVDEIIYSIGELVPSTAPIVKWYESRKIMIPPGKLDEIVAQTEQVVSELDIILNVYKSANTQSEAIHAND